MLDIHHFRIDIRYIDVRGGPKFGKHSSIEKFEKSIKLLEDVFHVDNSWHQTEILDGCDELDGIADKCIELEWLSYYAGISIGEFKGLNEKILQYRKRRK